MFCKSLSSSLLVAPFYVAVVAQAAWAQTPSVTPLLASASAMERRDGQEDIPAALIGAWQLDVQRSTYPTAAKPENDIRIFDYTRDGMLLCTHLTLTAAGVATAGNWTVKLDGPEDGREYLRSLGSMVFAVIHAHKRDESTIELTIRRFGQINETGTFTLSADGNTLNWAHESHAKKTNEVYRRWDTGK